MSRDDIIAILRLHEAELHRLGIVHLSLFGSTAPGEAGLDSDIDLLATFDPKSNLSLLDVLEIEHHLVQKLGREVDLVEESALKPRVRERAAKDAIRAF
jgi:predicted nucleotidyltransferase